MGWEQNVQHAAASASSSPDSSLHGDPVVASNPDGGLETAFTSAADAIVCHIEDAPQPKNSRVSELCTSRGFLTIARHGNGSAALYVVTYRRLDHHNVTTKPVLAEGANVLIELLERLGVNLQMSEVREALEDVHRFGSANIPDLWINEEQMTERELGQD